MPIFISGLIIIGSILCLFYLGILWFNMPSRKNYPVRGIDVSHHQGSIDWEKVKSAGIDFVFIKATEGVKSKDEFFSRNWKNAKKAGLKVGAYHFFSFRSSGKAQAGNFLSMVPDETSMLPPVIDLEFVGNSKLIPADKIICEELKKYIDEIESRYHLQPVFYLTRDSYEKFFRGRFEKYQVWIRDIFFKPSLPDEKSWLFWQYSCFGRVDGIQGYVDVNIFNGNWNNFQIRFK